MELGDFERFGRQIGTQCMGAASGHGVGQDATATSDVDDFFTLQRYQAFYPVQTQRVDLVQGTKLALGVPPAVGEFREFGQLGGVDVVLCGLHKVDCRLGNKKPRRSGVSVISIYERLVSACAHNFNLNAAVFSTAFAGLVVSHWLLLALAFCVDAVFLDAFRHQVSLH